MISLYEVLFYDGESSPPAYYLIDGVEAESSAEVIEAHLAGIVEGARAQLHLGADFPEHRILDCLFLSGPQGLVGVSKRD